MRAQLTQKMSETKKLNFSMTSSSFEKMYQNLYASGYDGTLVTMDGYRDPTERDNFIVSGNLVNEISTGNMTHTLLMGVEFIDTENKNLRYDAFWSSTSLLLMSKKFSPSRSTKRYVILSLNFSNFFLSNFGFLISPL